MTSHTYSQSTLDGFLLIGETLFRRGRPAVRHHVVIVSASSPVTPNAPHISMPNACCSPRESRDTTSTLNRCCGQGNSRIDVGERRSDVGESPVPARSCQAVSAAIGELMTAVSGRRSSSSEGNTVVTGTPGSHSPFSSVTASIVLVWEATSTFGLNILCAHSLNRPVRRVTSTRGAAKSWWAKRTGCVPQRQAPGSMSPLVTRGGPS